jgi:hypothetical protein
MQFEKRAQYAKRNCAFALFKAHCAATVTVMLSKKLVKRKERNRNFFKKESLKPDKFLDSQDLNTDFQISRLPSARLNHQAMRADLINPPYQIQW